jgi:hypothetical protein
MYMVGLTFSEFFYDLQGLKTCYTKHRGVTSKELKL